MSKACVDYVCEQGMCGTMSVSRACVDYVCEQGMCGLSLHESLDLQYIYYCSNVVQMCM